MVGVQKRIGHPPITALEPWTEESDRWCAAAPQPPLTPNNQAAESDNIRLGIQTNQQIYPTELVIEHYPSSGSLEPEVAPKDIELWADFSKLPLDKWKTLHIQDLIDQSSTDTNFLSWLAPRSSRPDTTQRTWARIGTATYHTTLPSTHSHDADYDDEPQEVSADQAYLGHQQSGSKSKTSWDRRHDRNRREEEKGHVQRFNLLINQNGLMHYSDRFLVRVRRNYGGTYTCLYRVRLHGLPAVAEGGRDRVETVET